MRKYLILIATLLLSIGVDAQIDGPDSFKADIIIDIVNKAIKDNNKKQAKSLYLNVDLRKKALFSDGMSYMPVMQDSLLVNDSLTEEFLSTKGADLRMSMQVVRWLDIGKINRNERLNYIFEDNEKGPNDTELTVYLEIGQPIDGWDIVDIIRNNYWLKKYGKANNGIFESVLYLPVVCAFYDKTNKNRVIKYYLYSYEIKLEKGRPVYRFVGNTPLNIG